MVRGPGRRTLAGLPPDGYGPPSYLQATPPGLAFGTGKRESAVGKPWDSCMADPDIPELRAACVSRLRLPRRGLMAERRRQYQESLSQMLIANQDY